jgi:hypothetical protein
MVSLKVRENMLRIGASELDQHFKEKRGSHLKHEGCHWKLTKEEWNLLEKELSPFQENDNLNQMKYEFL